MPPLPNCLRVAWNSSLRRGRRRPPSPRSGPGAAPPGRREAGAAAALVAQERLEVGTLGQQAVALARELHLLEPAQVAQAEIQDRLRLTVGQLEAPHQGRLRLVLLADDADHLVEVEEGLEI